MIYNHLRLGQQPRSFKTAVKPHLPSVVTSPRFLPEIARRLGDPLFTGELNIDDRHSLLRFVNEPRAYLLSLISSLDDRLQTALVTLMALGGEVDSPISNASAASAVAQRLGTSMRSLGTAFQELDGSLVRRVDLGPRVVWQPRHPTVIDALCDWLLGQSEMLDIYARYGPLGSLGRQVTCGANVKGAVALPSSLWPIVLDRILEFGNDTNSIGVRFFAYRCGPEPLQMRADAIVDLLERRGFFPPLDSDPGVRLFLRLDGAQLIPKPRTAELTKALIETSVTSLDPYCVRNPVVEHIVTYGGNEPDLWLSVIDSYVEYLRANLTSTVTRSIRDYARDVDPVDVFSRLFDLLSYLDEWLDDEADTRDLIDRERLRIRAWIGDPEIALGPAESAAIYRLVRALFPLEGADCSVM